MSDSRFDYTFHQTSQGSQGPKRPDLKEGICIKCLKTCMVEIQYRKRVPELDLIQNVFSVKVQPMCISVQNNPQIRNDFQSKKRTFFDGPNYNRYDLPQYQQEIIKTRSSGTSGQYDIPLNQTKKITQKMSLTQSAQCVHAPEPEIRSNRSEIEKTVYRSNTRQKLGTQQARSERGHEQFGYEDSQIRLSGFRQKVEEMKRKQQEPIQKFFQRSCRQHEQQQSQTIIESSHDSLSKYKIDPHQGVPESTKFFSGNQKVTEQVNAIPQTHEFSQQYLLQELSEIPQSAQKFISDSDFDLTLLKAINNVTDEVIYYAFGNWLMNTFDDYSLVVLQIIHQNFYEANTNFRAGPRYSMLLSVKKIIDKYENLFKAKGFSLMDEKLPQELSKLVIKNIDKKFWTLGKSISKELKRVKTNLLLTIKQFSNTQTFKKKDRQQILDFTFKLVSEIRRYRNSSNFIQKEVYQQKWQKDYIANILNMSKTQMNNFRKQLQDQQDNK